MDFPGNSELHVPLQKIQHSPDFRPQRAFDGRGLISYSRAAALICQVLSWPEAQSLSGVSFASEPLVFCACYQPLHPSDFDTEERESGDQLYKGKTIHGDMSAELCEQRGTKTDKIIYVINSTQTAYISHYFITFFIVVSF